MYDNGVVQLITSQQVDKVIVVTCLQLTKEQHKWLVMPEPTKKTEVGSYCL